jgi:hypothetical protein
MSKQNRNKRKRAIEKKTYKKKFNFELNEIF